MGDTELLRQSDTSIDLYNKDKDSVMVNVKVEGNSTVPDSICYSPSKDVDASVEMSAGGACSSLQSDTPKEPVTDATCVTDGIERYQTTDTIGQAVMISGDIFHRWQQVGNVHGLGSHSDIAAFLLTCYENSLPGPRVTGSERSLCPMCLAPLYCRNCNPVTHSEHDPVQKGRSTSRRSRGACKVNSVMGEDSGREHQTDADNDREEAVRKEIKMENHSDDEDGDADIHTFDDVESVKTPAGTARKAGRKTETTAGKRRGRKLQKPKKRDVQKSGLQPVMVDDEDTVRPYRCPECSKRYKSRMQCLNHLKCHDPCNFIYHCDQCPMTFYQRSYLKQHILRRHSDKTQVQVACEDCGKMLSSYQALICHRRIHTGELPYQCRDCDSKFRQYANLMRHQRTHHSTERPFSCTQCGAAFAVKNDLDLHLPTHSDLRPFLCQDCGSSFKTKGTLKEHMMCHTNTRTVPCHLCEQMFHNQSQLRKHLRSAKHFNVRDVVCSVCGARFNRQESLKQHMMLHTGHRPVECEECGKKFRNKGLMSVHMRIHTGERPAICDVCGRGFQTTGNMRKHRANVHKDAPTLPKHTPVRRSVNDIFHPRKLELFTFPVQAEHEDVSSPMAT